MKLIAHRGLTIGPNINLENKPKQIELTIKLGFDVEVDVWVIDDNIFLGHNNPTYPVDLAFLQNPQIWAHAKNYQALEYMLDHDIHCFWHQTDDRSFTSKGYVWTYPNKETFEKSILVVLDRELILDNKNIYGVCGDYVEIWKAENSNLFQWTTENLA